MAVTLQRYNFTLAAGGTFNIACTGSQFFITDATGALNITLDVGGQFKGLLEGQGYKGQPFTGLTLVDASGAANTGFILVSDDDYIDRRITGAVTFAPLNADFANTQETVTNVSAALLAANAARQYLLIQNNDTAGHIYVTLDGTPATLVNGVKLAAGGGALELSTVVPSGAINAIGSIASNANVLVVEG